MAARQPGQVGEQQAHRHRRHHLLQHPRRPGSTSRRATRSIRFTPWPEPLEVPADDSHGGRTPYLAARAAGGRRGLERRRAGAGGDGDREEAETQRRISGSPDRAHDYASREPRRIGRRFRNQEQSACNSARLGPISCAKESCPMRVATLALLIVVSAAPACKVYDPLYCDGPDGCTDPARPYCDLEGEHPASEGVARTCIPDPFAADARSRRRRRRRGRWRRRRRRRHSPASPDRSSSAPTATRPSTATIRAPPRSRSSAAPSAMPHEQLRHPAQSLNPHRSAD